MSLTKQLESTLLNNSLRELHNVKQNLNFEPNIVADIGANIGYYARALMKSFSMCIVHSYEPHPDNLQYLQEHANNRLIIHPYGLFNSDCMMKIGMRDDNKKNNGTYGIYNDDDPYEVEFKNANNELIRPDFVKMDIEGSEIYVLNCEDFLSNTKAILIEMVYQDDFKQNSLIETRMSELNFNKRIKISKNDWLWLR
jgi:FkbM family methyltransferase